MPTPSIQIASDRHAVAHAALRRLVDAADAAIAERGVFMHALSGGEAAKELYELIGQGVPWEPPISPIDWGKVEVFFTDEPCVSPEDAAGTYRTVQDAMLSRLPLLRADAVHRIRGELVPEEAAKEYGQLLKRRFGDDGPDVVILSLGEGGRIAGLFPHTAAVGPTQHRAVANQVPQLDAWWMTMTPAFLNRARQVIVLAVGEALARVVLEAHQEPKDPLRLPIQAIEPSNGKVTWIIDAEAAALLSVH